MVYKLTFTICEERKAPDGSPAEPYYYDNTIVSNDKNFEQDMEIAKAYSYNGEVLVEEVEDEPHSSTQADQIAELQAQLKAQQAVIDALLGEESKEEST